MVIADIILPPACAKPIDLDDRKTRRSVDRTNKVKRWGSCADGDGDGDEHLYNENQAPRFKDASDRSPQMVPHLGWVHHTLRQSLRV